MKIDILVPRFPPAHWNFSFAMDLEGSAYSHPPLGAATLAAYTPEGVDVRILDENVEHVDLETTAPVVAISSMYIQRAEAFAVADRLRRLGRTVILGGGLVNALPAECARHADVTVSGEAEETWPVLVEALATGTHRSSYTAPRRFDLKASRMPRYDLLKRGGYSTGSVQTSRGCPFRCDYCDVPLIDGSPSRTKPIDLVLREVETLYAMGHRSVFFVDDHFLGNRRYALQLLGELARFTASVKYKLLFYCQATLNVARDDEALEALYRANFRRLFIGIESDDLGALDRANKSHNTAMDIVEAVRKIQSHNITVWAALLAGFDEDTPAVFDRYLEFVRRANVAMIVPGILQAVPGTEYHARVEREGRLVPLRNGYVGGQAGSLDSLLVTNVEPKHMTYAELLSGYRDFVGRLYEYDAFADRLIGFLEAGTRPEHGEIDLGDVWAAKGVLARTIRHYVLTRDDERRRFVGRIVRHLVATKFRRADEAIFHVVIYKHLREFYGRAARASEPLATDVTRRAQTSAEGAAS